MKQSKPILISQAANGFIVNEALRGSGAHVFQSYAELSGFLATHFTFRAQNSIAGDNETVGAAPESSFITVPLVTLPNGTIVPSFQVGKYACSEGADGLAEVTAARAPWARINYHDARKACEDAGFHLITETQALAIAHDIAAQDINWTGGRVGHGTIYQGLHRGTVNEAQPATYEPNESERRWHQLSNGERIYDFAGNVYSWVFDDVQGDENGIVARAFTSDSPSISAPYAKETRGMGWRPDAGANWSGRALLRGGSWYSESDAGVFCLNYVGPGYEDDSVGFRCTK
jgi:formylglycine-generating enzyme required for sulfatase activity